jgi:exonuclease III
MWVVVLVFIACAQLTDGNDDGPEWTLASVDDPDRIEIITWNVEHFPKSGETINRLQAVLDSLNADIYCFQEIENTASLQRMFRNIDGYETAVSSETYMMHYVIAWQKDEFTALDIEDLFVNNAYYFASRPPLKVQFRWNYGDSLFVFNVVDLHMKAFGDASSRERRRNASRVIADYLVAQSPAESAWIIAGDWNDDINTSSGQYSFEPILDRPDDFMFVTEELSKDPEYASYPGWPSFIDHIMITSALFEAYENSTVTTLRLDKIFSDYFEVLSDHRPVMWKFFGVESGE